MSSAYEYITTPLFVAQSQWDSVFVHDTTAPLAAEYAKAVRDSMIPVQAAFSPRESIHVLSGAPWFYTSKIGAVSLRDLLGNFFFDRAGKIKAVKKCTCSVISAVFLQTKKASL